MIYRIITIYFIIVLIYFKFRHIENNKLEKIIFSIFVPVFGLISVILSENTKLLKENEKIEQKEKNNKEKNKDYFTQIQSSLIDNLLIEDYEKVREMVLYSRALKLEEQCKICHMAIKSKDVEISHIAAVTLMKIQNYFEKFFLHMELKTDMTKAENLKKYINGLNNYLRCKLAQGALKNKYREKLIQSIKYLLMIDEKCEEIYYNILINCFMEEAEYDKAMQYLKNEINIYGMTEETYKLTLKICIRTKNIDNLNETLEKIKANSIMATKLKKTLEFWN